MGLMIVAAFGSLWTDPSHFDARDFASSIVKVVAVLVVVAWAVLPAMKRRRRLEPQKEVLDAVLVDAEQRARQLRADTRAGRLLPEPHGTVPGLPAHVRRWLDRRLAGWALLVTSVCLSAFALVRVLHLGATAGQVRWSTAEVLWFCTEAIFGPPILIIAAVRLARLVRCRWWTARRPPSIAPAAFGAPVIAGVDAGRPLRVCGLRLVSPGHRRIFCQRIDFRRDHGELIELCRSGPVCAVARRRRVYVFAGDGRCDRVFFLRAARSIDEFILWEGGFRELSALPEEFRSATNPR